MSVYQLQSYHDYQDERAMKCQKYIVKSSLENTALRLSDKLTLFSFRQSNDWDYSNLDDLVI